MKIPSVFTNIIRKYFGQANESPKSASYDEVNKAEKLFYSQYVSQGMTVFDVGANAGELTGAFSQLVGNNGVVHAFEPSSETYARLASMIQLKEQKNVIINNCALSDEIGTAKFHVYDVDHSTLNSLAERPLKKYGIDAESSIEEVSTMTVDAYCHDNHIEHIDLLKVDVEGAELKVFYGARAMMRDKRIGCCIFEFGQTIFDMGTNPQEINDFFKECDYRLRNLVEGDPVFPGGESVSTAQFSMHIAEPNS